MTQVSTRRSRIATAATRVRVISAAGLVVLAGLGVGFVGVTTSGARTGHATTKVHAASVSGLGSVLETASGRVLYVFSPDHRTHVSCLNTCEKYWFPMIASGSVVAGSGVKQSLLGKIKASNGKEVVTYNKWPLYTYVADTKAGEASGQGIVTFGGTWKAIHPTGTPATKQSSGGGGYGY